MKKVIYTIACAAIVLASTKVSAQPFTKKYSNERDHSHYEVESLEEDLFMGGTTFEAGSFTDTDIHAQRLDISGSIVWENRHNIGSEERCLDITLVGDELMVLTGTTIIAGNHRIFLMSLDQATGTLVDYKIINNGPAAHVEQTVTEVIYSETTGELYLAGYTFNGGHVNEGLLFALDASSFAINWVKETPREITAIEEIDGVGIYVAALTHAAVDYSGNPLWQVNTGTHAFDEVVDAEYDAANDRILAAEYDGGIIELTGVSGSATLGQLVWVGDNTRDYRNIQNVDLEINPSTNELMLLQVAEQDMIAYRNYLPCIVSLDLASLSVNHGNVTKTHNPNAYYHFQDYKYNFGGVMSMTEWGGNFGVVFYEHPDFASGVANEYDLKIIQTDNVGVTGLDCEQEIPMHSGEIPEVSQAATSFTTVSYSLGTPSYEDKTSGYSIGENCFELESCGLTVNHFIKTYTDCYEYNFSVDYTANPGTVITNYTWTWGDGSTTSTTDPNTVHLFSNSKCQYNVCVTVTAIGADGTICSDSYCRTVGMQVMMHCEPCGEGYGEGRGAVDGSGNGFGVDMDLTISPNPSANNFTIELTGEELNGQFVLLNSLGQVVYTSENVEGNYFLTTIDGSTLEKGIYLLQFRNGADVITKKIVKL